VLGTASEDQVRYDEPLTTQWFEIGPEMFLQARNYYRDHPDDRGKKFLALDRHGRAYGVLAWRENRNRYPGNAKGRASETYWSYDFRDGYVNDDLLERASGYVFQQLEEYTHAIATYLLRYHPKKHLYFLDERASLPVWEMKWKNLHVIKTPHEIPQGRWYMYIDSSDWNQSTWVPQYLTLMYNSKNVINSMLWGNRWEHPGDLYPERRVILLNPYCWGGLVDVINTVVGEAAHAESQGLIPVVDLTTYDSAGQYYAEGKNAWGELFLPVSSITVQEARRCKNLLQAKVQYGKWYYYDPYHSNPYLRETEPKYDKAYYRKWTRLNDETWKVVLQKAPAALHARLQRVREAEAQEKDMKQPFQDGLRILGVMARGTDYRKEATVTTAQNASLQTMLSWSKSLIASGCYTHVFVATEDAEYFAAFQKAFGDKLLYIDQTRVSHDYVHDGWTPVGVLLVRAGAKGIPMTRTYLSAVKCLSICDDVIYSMSCGAGFMASVWNEERYGISRILRDDQIAPMSPQVARVDIKSYGKDNTVDVTNLDAANPYQMPARSWYCDAAGKGRVLSPQGTALHFRVTCHGAGQFQMECRDRAMGGPSKERFLPMKVTYTSVLINGEPILQGEYPAWHNDPLRCSKSVEDGESFEVEIHWKPYAYSPQEMSSLLQRLL